jgi:hypothetical protein
MAQGLYIVGEAEKSVPIRTRDNQSFISRASSSRSTTIGDMFQKCAEQDCFGRV